MTIAITITYPVGHPKGPTTIDTPAPLFVASARKTQRLIRNEGYLAPLDGWTITKSNVTPALVRAPLGAFISDRLPELKGEVSDALIYAAGVAVVAFVTLGALNLLWLLH